MNIEGKKVELAPGLVIPRVVSGLWQVADMERDGRELDRQQAARGLRPYVDAGLTAFDMADHYGSAEKIAGTLAATPDLGSPVQLLTKWVPPPGAVNARQVRDAVLRALERLGVEQIDLMQFHAWNYADPAYLDSLFQLEQLRSEGLISRIGLTNFDAAHLALVCASGVEVVSNQVSYSLLDTRAAGALSEVSRAHGVALLAYGTLAGGLLSEKWLGEPEPDAEALSTWSRMKYKRFIDASGGWGAFQRLLQTLHRVAERRGEEMAGIAARWVLDQPAVAAVIVGVRPGDSHYLERTSALLELQLDGEEREEIAGAVAELGPIPGDCGDEYRRPPYLTASGDLSHHVEAFPAPYRSEDHGRGSHVSSGTPWEKIGGYCRAVRRGNHVWIAGTTATHRDRLIGGADAAAQTHFIIDKIEGALQSVGGALDDVVRTRIYVRNTEDWEAAARVHGARFATVRPTNTLVCAEPIGEGYLVEVEAEAWLTDTD